MVSNKTLYQFGLLFISFIVLTCERNDTPKLTIATAANMQFAMEKIVESFERKTGVTCETIVSSSGKLTAQIQEGAPFDLFVSADLKYPQRLFERNKTIDEPKVYAYGKLVLWSANKIESFSIGNLQNADIQNIALANPKIAPYGFAAIEVLENYDLLEKIGSKLVYGESIAQTNQFIMSGAATFGFTAKSVVLSPELKGKGSWIEMNHTTYTPIQQAMVILKSNPENQEKAKQFYTYLFSLEGQQILEDFGYKTIPPYSTE